MANKIFAENHEEVFDLFVKIGNGKETKRQVGFRIVCRDTYGGHLTKSGKVMGKWIWNKSRFSQPVFFSALVEKNGRPARITRGPLIESLANLIVALTGNDKTMFRMQETARGMKEQAEAMAEVMAEKPAEPEEAVMPAASPESAGEVPAPEEKAAV